VDFSQWEKEASDSCAQKQDPLWRMRAYRLAVFLAEYGWMDARLLAREELTREMEVQLYRAIGSIRANLAEGYGRSAGRERGRYFEHALGSARESREWYVHTRHVLGEPVVTQRTSVLDEIARLLLAIIPRERDRSIRKVKP
jgi:four helix bundle protein